MYKQTSATDKSRVQDAPSPPAPAPATLLLHLLLPHLLPKHLLLPPHPAPGGADLSSGRVQRWHPGSLLHPLRPPPTQPGGGGGNAGCDSGCCVCGTCVRGAFNKEMMEIVHLRHLPPPTQMMEIKLIFFSRQKNSKNTKRP